MSNRPYMADVSVLVESSWLPCVVSLLTTTPFVLVIIVENVTGNVEFENAM